MGFRKAGSLGQRHLFGAATLLLMCPLFGGCKPSAMHTSKVEAERELDELWYLYQAHKRFPADGEDVLERKKKHVATLGYEVYAGIVDRYLGRGARKGRATPLAYVFEVNQEVSFEMLALYIKERRQYPEGIGEAINWVTKLDEVPLADRVLLLEKLLDNKQVCEECDPKDPAVEYRLAKVHRERVCDRALLSLSMLLKGKIRQNTWASRQIAIHGKHDNGPMSEGEKWAALDRLVEEYREAREEIARKIRQ